MRTRGSSPSTLKLGILLGFRDGRRGGSIIGPHLFSGEQNMDGIARLRIGLVEKHFVAQDIGMNKSRAGEGA